MKKIGPVKKYINLKIILLIIIFLMLFFLAVPYTAFYFGKVAVLEFFLTVMPQKHLSGINILAVGIDNTKDVQRSDTIMIFHLNKDKNSISVLSVPRDTRVNIPGIGFTKINRAYPYGGINLLRKTIADLLSIPIDYYIKVNLAGVEKIIDTMGGISFNVPKDFYYVDTAGELYINIEKGEQVLSGKKAVEFLRFRQDIKGDIGRIERQQSFLKSVTETLLTGNILKTPSLVAKLSSSVETDLKLSETIGLAVQFGAAFRSGRIESGTVPGAVTMVQGVSYWRPDIVALDRMIEEVLFGFEIKPVMAQKMKVKTVDKKASKEDARRKLTLKEVSRIIEHVEEEIFDLDRSLVLEALNGNGQVGGAQRVAAMLKKEDLKVVRFDNAGSFTYPNTLIVDWKGNLEKVIKLAGYLYIDPEHIIVYDRPQKGLDVTIVIGSDWPEIEKKLEERKKQKNVSK
jgi:polyisoprenyl-teichoic acid--peptidoglycan teichoic acid transferase